MLKDVMYCRGLWNETWLGAAIEGPLDPPVFLFGIEVGEGKAN